MTLTVDFQGHILKKSYLGNGMADWHGTKGMWVDRMLDSHCDFKLSPHPWPWFWIFKVKVLKLLQLKNGRVDSHGMKGMWVGYDIGCTTGLTLGHGAWQIDQPSNGSMWNSCSFQPVGQWMGYSFTDLGAEGCCRSPNVLLQFPCTWRIPYYRYAVLSILIQFKTTRPRVYVASSLEALVSCVLDLGFVLVGVIWVSMIPAAVLTALVARMSIHSYILFVNFRR